MLQNKTWKYTKLVLTTDLILGISKPIKKKSENLRWGNLKLSDFLYFRIHSSSSVIFTDCSGTASALVLFNISFNGK